MLLTVICKAQNDTITRLDEVVVMANKRLKENSKAYKVTFLSDSIIVNNLESFTSLLRFNSPIYLKEYGQGGTSSASFRGTSSSNTAVMWNGININSVNNGQTGFNSLTVGLFDNITIRSGGGSIEYGSGAVGGTIHLQDILNFSDNKNMKNQIVTSVGSFKTINALYKLKYSSKKYAFNVGLSLNKSDNDFPIHNSEYKNSNGAYKNYTINFANSYKFSENLLLDFYTTYYFADRLLSGKLPNPTSEKSKYKDTNQRNLLSLQYKKNNIDITARLGYLFQKYQYFSDKDNPKFNFGSSDRYFTKLVFDYKIPVINAIITSNSKYESTFGKTDQITVKNRREFSQSLIFKHSIHPNVFYDVKVRKDVNSDYEVPISYAFGFKVKPFNKFFIRANTSKNYRVPTYNDLYWPNQGNENLIPETSLQGEFGFGYQSKKIYFDIAYFTIFSKDNIVWTPNGDPNRPGVWTPINLEKTKNKGIELSANIEQSIFKKVKAKASINFTHTIAKNEELDKLLPFIPKNLINTNITLNFRRFSMFYQYLFNDKIYTTTSNSEDYIVDEFYISNVGASYKIISKDKQNLSVGCKVNNIFNKGYVVLPSRPMPKIHYNFNINYKF